MLWVVVLLCRGGDGLRRSAAQSQDTSEQEGWDWDPISSCCVSSGAGWQAMTEPGGAANRGSKCAESQTFVLSWPVI